MLARGGRRLLAREQWRLVEGADDERVCRRPFSPLCQSMRDERTKSSCCGATVTSTEVQAFGRSAYATHVDRSWLRVSRTDSSAQSRFVQVLEKKLFRFFAHPSSHTEQATHAVGNQSLHGCALSPLGASALTKKAFLVSVALKAFMAAMIVAMEGFSQVEEAYRPGRQFIVGTQGIKIRESCAISLGS